MAGQYWAATGLTCSQMTSQIGNNVAGMVFDMAKSLDRVTITVYQSAAGANILSWLSNSVNQLIKSLGNAIYFPFLAPMVIIAAIWLAWTGLVRKRATRTFEGTVWIVIACAAAIWLIGQPGDFTNVGTTVSNGVTSVLNSAFSKLPATAGSNCLPVAPGDQQAVANYSFTSGNGLVDQNANELWTVLVCKPWLDGELGSTQYATSAAQPQTVVNQYGRQLLWAQAVASNEAPTSALVGAKQATYTGIANQLKTTNPSVYSLFQGDQWTTRLEIGFEALFAAVAAGLLVLLIALTLIMLKLGFLLLLVAGPFFLIIGIHPGFGRVDRDPLVRDAGRRADETDRGRADPQRPALLLLADHGHHRHGAALGAQDHDDRARHGDRGHLPQAVPAPVLLGRLRHARRRGTRPGELARVHLRLPAGDRERGGRRRPRRGRPRRVPLGPARHGGLRRCV